MVRNLHRCPVLGKRQVHGHRPLEHVKAHGGRRVQRQVEERGPGAHDVAVEVDEVSVVRVRLLGELGGANRESEERGAEQRNEQHRRKQRLAQPIALLLDLALLALLLAQVLGHLEQLTSVERVVSIFVVRLEPLARGAETDTHLGEAQLPEVDAGFLGGARRFTRAWGRGSRCRLLRVGGFGRGGAGIAAFRRGLWLMRGRTHG
mmetsp:Transcript_33494/g.99689  ORF Transcript_33494/g.99689 Transcript_33494/m.99689 type:complete len:205 (-) Transcript_33494:33-647(-)